MYALTCIIIVLSQVSAYMGMHALYIRQISNFTKVWGSLRLTTSS